MDKAITRPVILAFSLPYPLVHIILGLANLHRVTSIVPPLIAMVICVAVILLVSLPEVGKPLRLSVAWAAVIGVVLIEVLVKGVLPAGEHPGYAAWHNGAIQMLLVTVALRGRMGVAWLGMGVFVDHRFHRVPAPSSDHRGGFGHGSDTSVVAGHGNRAQLHSSKVRPPD